MPNLAALHFQSLTPVSSSLPSADHLDLSAVRVFTPMLLLAGRGVLLCSTSGHPVLPSAVCIGVYVVLHLLCGDWPSLWSIGPMMFLRVPAWHSWPLMLPHRSITSGCSYCWSLRSVFPHVTALLAHHQVNPCVGLFSIEVIKHGLDAGRLGSHPDRSPCSGPGSTPNLETQMNYTLSTHEGRHTTQIAVSKNRRKAVRGGSMACIQVCDH